MNVLLNLGKQTWFWLAIFVTCLGLDVGAIFYQEVLDFYPCELCIYVRVWVIAIGLLSLVGAALCGKPWPRRILLLAQFALVIGLTNETLGLLQVEYSWNLSGSCNFVANFPGWAPLDKWWPMMFEVQSLCSATPIIFWKISMAHSLALVCVGFLTALGFSLVGEVLSIKRRV